MNIRVTTYLNIAEIILSFALIVFILLQSRGSGMGTLFGGDASGGQYKTRRGLEKTLFQATIGLAIVWGLVALLNLVFTQ